jgi:hypothetical protein
MAGLKAEVVGFKECGEKLPYETGRVVRNWAQTFECRPERLYVPKNEDEVVEVRYNICCESVDHWTDGRLLILRDNMGRRYG